MSWNLMRNSRRPNSFEILKTEYLIVGCHSFNGVIDNYDKLQLYKYELKKNSNGDFYLYGYNPVNDVSIGWWGLFLLLF